MKKWKFILLIAIAMTSAMEAQENQIERKENTEPDNSIQPIYSVNTELLAGKKDIAGNKFLINAVKSQDKVINYTYNSSYDKDNDKPGGNLHFKESFIQGSVKAGINAGFTQLLVSDAEYEVFGESEIFNTTFKFLRSTNTPFISGQLEYMLFNSVGIGGYAGYSNSKGDNRNSNGVNENIELIGTTAGGYITYYLPVENWLYLGVSGVIPYEKGQVKTTDGVNYEKFDFVRYGILGNLTFYIAPSERVQIGIGGMNIGYLKSEYDGKSEISRIIDNEDGTQTTVVTRLDQKIKKKNMEFDFSPRLTILLTLIPGGGR